MLSENLTLPMVRSVGLTNKELTALTGFSNPSVWANQPIAEHHQVILRPVYADRLAGQSTGVAVEVIAVDDNLTSQIKMLCKAGLYLVPIAPIDGKPTKGPVITGWNLPRTTNNQHGYSNNPDDFINCKEGYNIGICHKPSGTVAVDIDDLNACLPLFETVGLDLSGWLNDKANVKIESGKPNRAKVLFRLPESCDPIITRQYSHNKTMLFELRHSAKTGASVQDIIVGVHPETGTDYRIIGDIGNIQIIPDELLDVALFWDDWKPVFDSVLGVVEPKEAPRKPLEGENLKGYRNPIVEYNAKHTVREVLERNGYRPIGTDRYIRPNSSSHAPGIKILTNCRDGKERAWSFGGDVLNTGFASDAFDCFRLLECKGQY
ncbi:MAG: bifunctional DNA primase/polymerase [Methylovulum sp.]